MSDTDSDSGRAAGSWRSGAGGWVPPPGVGAHPPASPAPPPGDYTPPPQPAGGYAPPPQPPAGGYAPPPQPPAGGYAPPPQPSAPPGDPWGGRPPGGPWPPAVPANGAPRPRARWMVLVAAVAGVMLLGGIGVGWGLATAGVIRSIVSTHSPIHTVPQVGAGPGANGPVDVQAITNKVSPAIVDINTTLANQGGQAAGTGMILTSSGEVLTNNHVVEGSTSLKVSVQGRSTTYSAHVVGVSRTADVALVQIEGASGLPTVTLANTSNLTVGQQVVALGNALGQGGAPSVTQGAITALDQSITAGGNGIPEQLTGLIQADAPISPGDSGGPLVNAAGQVIGMVTAGETQGARQSTSTIGYAVPSNTAVNVVNQVRSGNASSSIIIGQPGFLGIGVRDLTPATAARLGLSVSSGVVVTSVASGSPAEKIGISQNSVITAINGSQIGTSSDVAPAIQTHKPGDKLQVTWVDQSGSHTATATLVGGPAA
jgi:S1-C subfamily serine protease